MSVEKDKVKFIRNELPSFEVVPMPQDILELDEETVAIGKAKLAGVEFEDIFGQEDQTSPEFLVRQQRQIIKGLFHSVEEVKIAFSSSARVKQTMKDIAIDGVDLDFIKNYCSKMQIKFSDDATALVAFGFGVQDSGVTHVET